MGTKRRTRRIIVICVICFVIAALTIAAIHKPAVAQYKDDFGFSLENINIETLDYYHHDDFRDSITIYRVSVTGDIQGSIFDRNKMADGLSEEIELLLNDAVDLTKEKRGFEDLESIDLSVCRSIELKDTNNNTDACLYIISYGSEDQFIVIWNG